jgi:uncharacterized lipoprotein YehR (DUF1307 family)
MFYLKKSILSLKKYSFLLFAIIMTISLAACSKPNVEGMVATVDGVGITQEEFDAEYKVYRTMFENN